MCAYVYMSSLHLYFTISVCIYQKGHISTLFLSALLTPYSAQISITAVQNLKMCCIQGFFFFYFIFHPDQYLSVVLSKVGPMPNNCLSNIVGKKKKQKTPHCLELVEFKQTHSEFSMNGAPWNQRLSFVFTLWWQKSGFELQSGLFHYVAVQELTAADNCSHHWQHYSHRKHYNIIDSPGK